MSKNTIKITKQDKFVWKIITSKEAKAIMRTLLFPVYAIYEDDSESLIGDLAELEELSSNGDVNFGIEVGFTNYREVEELKKLLKHHDYHYQRSDDHRAYKSGRAVEQRISELSNFVDKEDFKRWWNRSAPQGLQREV